MKKTLLFWISLFFILVSCNEDVKISDEQKSVFIKFYGNSYEDVGNDIKQTSKGGYAVIGTTTLINDGQRGNTDILFLQTNAYGNLLHDPVLFGGGENDAGNALDITDDGGFILAGTFSDVGNNKGKDMYIIRLDGQGATLWAKQLGGAGDEEALSIKTTSSGFVVAGYTQTYGNGGKDQWILGLNENGDTLWTATHGLEEFPGNLQTSDDIAMDVIENNDGYWLAGYSSDFINTTNTRIFLRPTNSQGIGTGWNTDYAIRSVPERGKKLIQRSDGTVLLLGSQSSGAAEKSIYLAEFGSSVSLLNWEKYIKVPVANLSAQSFLELPDQSIAILSTRETGGNTDILLTFTDPDGNEISSVSFGDNTEQYAKAFMQTSDGGFIITGSTVFEGNSMVMLIKTKAGGIVD